MNLIIFSDGGSRGNPGKAAYGFVIKDDAKNLIYKEGKFIGIETNNVAEYTGILRSFEWIKKNIKTPISSISYFLDSELAVRQLTNVYRVKNPALKIIYMYIKKIENEMDIPVSFSHVPREQNKEADLLVNIALDNAS